MSDQFLSLLSGEEIKQLGLVEDAREDLYRASTYDLSIEEIIPSGGIMPEGSKFPLSPGGMVRVISKEFLKLPDTVTGHVLLKNQLCTQGVLAISIRRRIPERVMSERRGKKFRHIRVQHS